MKLPRAFLAPTVSVPVRPTPGSCLGNRFGIGIPVRAGILVFIWHDFSNRDNRSYRLFRLGDFLDVQPDFPSCRANGLFHGCPRFPLSTHGLDLCLEELFYLPGIPWLR